MTDNVMRDRLQAIIDWADIALKNPEEFNSHGVRNLAGPVFDAAREALAENPAPAESLGGTLLPQLINMAVNGAAVSLATCPPGPFLFNGHLGFKTEYGAMSGKDAGSGQVEWSVSSYPDVYVMDSGETFWGGVSSQEDRAALLVNPVELYFQDAPTAPAPEMPGAADAYMRLITLFDQDATAGSFLSEDGEGGFVGGVYRMAREIDLLRSGIKRLSDEEELCAETTGDDPFSLVSIAAKLATAEAAADSLRLDRDHLRSAVTELKFALFSSDMTIKDRADQAARLILAATASEGEQ